MHNIVVDPMLKWKHDLAELILAFLVGDPSPFKSASVLCMESHKFSIRTLRVSDCVADRSMLRIGFEGLARGLDRLSDNEHEHGTGYGDLLR